MSDPIAKIILQADSAQYSAEMRKAEQATDKFRKAVEATSGATAGGGGAANDPFAAAVSSAHEADTARARRDHQEQIDNAKKRDDEHHSKTGYRDVRRGAEQLGSVIQGFAGPGVLRATGEAIGTTGGYLGGMGGTAGMLAAGAAIAAVAIKVANNLADKEYARIAPLFTTGLSQRLGVGNFESMVSTYYWQGLKTGMPEEMTMRLLAAWSGSGGTLQAGGSGRNAGFLGGGGEAFQLAGRAALNLGVEPTTLGGYLGLLSKLGINMVGPAANNQFYAQGMNAFGVASLGRFVESSTGIIRDMETRMRAADITTAGITAQENRLAVLGAYGGFTIEGASNIEQRVRAQRLASSGLGRPEDVMSFMINRQPGEDVVDTMMRMRTPGADYQMFDFIKKTTPDKLLRFRVMQTFNIDPESVDGFIEAMNKGMGAAVTGQYSGVPGLNETFKGALVGTQMKQWDIMGLPEKWMLDVRNNILRKTLYQYTGIDLMGDLAEKDAASKATAGAAATKSIDQADVVSRVRSTLRAQGKSEAEIDQTIRGIESQVGYQTQAAFGGMTTAEQYQTEYLKEMRDFLEQIVNQQKNVGRTTTDQR
jgi:hypothetical protein